jgi:predicted amidohydrolase
MKKITLAVVQYALSMFSNFEEYSDKIHRLVSDAKKQEGDLVLFAEYAGAEITGWLKGETLAQFEQMQDYLPRYLDLHQQLADQFQIYIQAGTIPVKENNHYKNRAYFFGPNSSVAFQDKLYLTPFELALGQMKASDTLTLFDTAFGKIGITICYDSEFPHLAHQLAAAGANLILVPSCTETMHGFNRVAISCRARALENQLYVAQSPLVGSLSSSDLIDANVGRAGIFSPPDLGFTDDGIVKQGNLNADEMIIETLEWRKIERVRSRGQMRNFSDMQLPHQFTLQTKTV